MTLDEAIKRFKSVKLYKNFKEFVENCSDSRVRDKIKTCGNNVNLLSFRGYGICDEDHCPDYKKCVEHAKEYHQLTEWLKELKQLKEQKSILDKIKDEVEGKYRVILKSTPKDDWVIRWNDCLDEVLEIIDKYKESER